MNYLEDTIAAISTSTVGSSGIGIIRMSGRDAVSIADKIFRSKSQNKSICNAKTHTIHYGNIVDGKNVIDEVLLMLMKGPNSYTCEDIVEIDCHGGIVVINKILETCFKYGARPAEPGEFTKRAFLNGRIDLSQAEAVIDIINSKNDMALKSSVNQLSGYFSDKINEFRKIIINRVAFIEAALDDPEHYSLDGFKNELIMDINPVMDGISKLIDNSENGRVVKDGINTVILGKPNAGKSSLMNVLAKYERAIVTDIPGTTRDTIEEQININGVLLNLIDTAGIRNTEDVVESIGVDKAKECALNADLVIYVVDSSVDIDENDRKIIDIIKDKNVIIILNKSDLSTIVTESNIKDLISAPIVSISTKTYDGVSYLESTIKDIFISGKINVNDELIISNLRQKNSLKEAQKSLKLVVNSIDMGMPEDFYTVDLLNAYEELGKIIGESVEEDLVNEIFQKFCMGK